MDDQMIDALVKELLPELLPAVVLDFAALIGYRATIRLVQALGGIDFQMPKRGAGRHYQLLVDAVGDAAAQKVIKRHSGERLYIPRCHAALTQLRNQEFRAAINFAVARGSSQQAAIQQYAPQYGFSERWAYKVLREENRRAEQIQLF